MMLEQPYVTHSLTLALGMAWQTWGTASTEAGARVVAVAVGRRFLHLPRAKREPLFVCLKLQRNHMLLLFRVLKSVYKTKFPILIF